MTVNLDRFSQGLPDPADARVMAECAGCGGEIYAGDFVYVLDGDIVHSDVDCLLSYLDLEMIPVEEALG